MKYYFTSILLFLCFIALNGKTVSGFQTNDPFAPTTTSNDGSNIELYFDGYSHPNCANAEYLGDVVAYDTYVWGYIESWLENVKMKANAKYNADIICGAKIEYLLVGNNKQVLSFYGTGMRKRAS